MNILDKIIEHKKVEVKAQKEKLSVKELEQSEFFGRETFSLKQFLSDENRTGIIAEFKRQSPSKGIINANAGVASVTEAYAKYASGISVLTDEKFFGGSIPDLLHARFNAVPLLRKDFMIDAYQIIEAKSIGADVVLLIAACLTPPQVRHLASVAKELRLEVLLEIHNEAELNRLCDEVDLVGINNRNLKNFEMDVENSIRLKNLLPHNKPAIAESGIHNVEMLKTLQRAGFKGFLMGEKFMKEKSPALAFENFVQELISK